MSTRAFLPRFAALLAALAAATPATAQPTPRRPRVAILEVRALGIAAEKAQALSEVALTEASNIAGLDVIGRSDIQAMIGFEKEKQMLGCSDDSKCMTEIAGALGVDWILVGSLGQFDALYRLDLKLIDAKRSKIAGRIGESIEGSQARLVSSVQAGVHKLLDPIARAAAEVASRPSPPAEQPAPRGAPPPAEKPAPARASAEPVAAPAEPSGTPPSPARPEGPIARPWSVELRLGIASYSGGKVDPSALRPGGFGELDLVGAYQLNRRWSFYAALVGHSSTSKETPLAGGSGSLLINPTRVSFGAAWNPVGNPYFAVAADVGFVRAKAEARAVTEVSTQSKTGPAFGLEARADYPLGERWYVGARVGVHMAFTGFDLRVRDPATGREVRLENDMGFLSGLAAVGYRF